MSYGGESCEITHRHFYIQTLSQTRLHTETFTHKRFYTQTLLHADAFTNRRFYTQMLLHTEAFTHRHFYTQTLLHTDPFTHRPFYTQTLLHTDAFTRRCFYTHLETPQRETMKWDEMRIHVSSCWVFGFAQLPYWDYCRYTRLIRPCIPLQGIASLHWVCQGVPNAPARWYTNSKRTIETHVLHAWRCTDVSDWNLYATWTSSR